LTWDVVDLHKREAQVVVLDSIGEALTEDSETTGISLRIEESGCATYRAFIRPVF